MNDKVPLYLETGNYFLEKLIRDGNMAVEPSMQISIEKQRVRVMAGRLKRDYGALPMRWDPRIFSVFL